MPRSPAGQHASEIHIKETRRPRDRPTISRTQAPRVSANASSVEFRYIRSSAAPGSGVAFTVQWSDSLAAGSWSSAGVTEEILADTGTEQSVRAMTPAGTGGRRGPDLTEVGSRLASDPLTWRILAGGTNMPAYGQTLTPEELTALVSFLSQRRAGP